MCIKKETKSHPYCCFHSNSFGPSLFTSKYKKIPICNLYGGTKGPTWNRNSSHIALSPVIRLGRVDGSCFKTKPGISVFINTAPVAKLLSWQQHQGCHFVSFLMHICGAKFQDHCFNISRDIVYKVFSTF